ncbi:MAG TPA: DUF4276 family protein [Smithellaceae bacterium]|mgnify:CR=1 FL=1|nr:DUF4276 family protein [Smithellaceae bacterium]
MVSIKIYIEGGGEGKDLDSRFREAWSKFFKAAGLSGQMPRPVRGKGRLNTHDLFVTAFNARKADELPLLLLDSEEALQDGHTVWQHLKARDNMEKPLQATEEHVYLMVQVMETWLLADPDALRRYFGSKCKIEKIPAWMNLEVIDKQRIFDTLQQITADCGVKVYAKGKVSFELLGTISPEKVKEKCPNAKRLLDFLAAKR